MTVNGDKGIIQQMLDIVPELTDSYREMAEWYSSIGSSEADLEDLRKIREMHGLEESDNRLPGNTIVFEELLIPFVISLLEERKRLAVEKLQAVLTWVEELAASDDQRMRELVAISVCQPFMTNYGGKFSELFPFLGNETKNLCRQQLSAFNVHEGIKSLLT